MYQITAIQSSAREAGPVGQQAGRPPPAPAPADGVNIISPTASLSRGPTTVRSCNWRPKKELTPHEGERENNGGGLGRRRRRRLIVQEFIRERQREKRRLLSRILSQTPGPLPLSLVTKIWRAISIEALWRRLCTTGLFHEEKKKRGKHYATANFLSS